MNHKSSKYVIGMICFGLAFLYIPIFLLIFYSFNYSKNRTFLTVRAPT